MFDTTTVTKKIRDFNIEHSDWRKDYASFIKNEFMAKLQELIGTCTYIQTIAWTQYTPSWNDGDPCTLCVRCDYDELIINEDIEDYDDKPENLELEWIEKHYPELCSKEYGLNNVYLSDIGYYYEYLDKLDENPDYDYKTTIHNENEYFDKRWKEGVTNCIEFEKHYPGYLTKTSDLRVIIMFSELLNNIDYEILESVFDDNQKITVSKNKYTTDYYSHD